MVKANELRVGNYIYWNIPEKINTFHEVVGIRNGKPQTIPISLGESISDYLPIPLTPEILEKCGFVKPSKNDNHGGLLISIGNDISIRLKPLINGSGYYWDNFNGAYKVIVNHLHQLQNLYFALTGEELTFKP